MKYEDENVARDWTYIDPVRKAGEYLSKEERMSETDRIYDWYESQFRAKKLTIMSMSGKGFLVFPTGCRTWSEFAEEWLVPEKYTFWLNWSTLKVFIGYPPWIQDKMKVPDETTPRDETISRE